jgi:hypothetical protein
MTGMKDVSRDHPPWASKDSASTKSVSVCATGLRLKRRMAASARDLREEIGTVMDFELNEQAR